MFFANESSPKKGRVSKLTVVTRKKILESISIRMFQPDLIARRCAYLRPLQEELKQTD